MTTSRDVRWLQRRTNIADLLDDGVENYSDLRNAVAEPAQEAAEPESPPAHGQQRPDANAIPVRPTPEHASRLGVLVGAFLAISCALLYLHPADFMAFHPGRTNRLRLEHVTIQRCRAYGAIGVVVGIGLLAFSLYRPRSDA